MPLTQIQINTLKSLFEPMTKKERLEALQLLLTYMDKDELDKALDLLIEEAFKRVWDNQPLVKEAP